VTALVKSSLKVNKLSNAALAALPNASKDAVFYPIGRGRFCDNVAECTLGPKQATKSVVLFGDSHAAMWVPAILPAVVKSGAKLILLWQGTCPVAKVDVNWPAYGDPDACNGFRANMVTLINQINPEAVFIGERSGGVMGMNGFYTSNSQWATALETTIKAIEPPGRSIAVIEDTPQSLSAFPSCIAAHLTSVQACTVTFASPTSPGLQVGQRIAAKATGAAFITTQAWFCTIRCPAVIGNMIPYSDGSHVSTTYATFLSGLMGKAITPLLH